METNLKGTRYGDSYIGYNVSRLVYRVQCMETHKEGTMYGEPYRGCNVWRII